MGAGCPDDPMASCSASPVATVAGGSNAGGSHAGGPSASMEDGAGCLGGSVCPSQTVCPGIPVAKPLLIAHLLNGLQGRSTCSCSYGLFNYWPCSAVSMMHETLNSHAFLISPSCKTFDYSCEELCTAALCSVIRLRVAF